MTRPFPRESTELPVKAPLRVSCCCCSPTRRQALPPPVFPSGCGSGQYCRCWQGLRSLLSPGREDSTAGALSLLCEGLMCEENNFRFAFFFLTIIFIFFPLESDYTYVHHQCKRKWWFFGVSVRFYKELLDKQGAVSQMWMTSVKRAATDHLRLIMSCPWGSAGLASRPCCLRLCAVQYTGLIFSSCCRNEMFQLWHHVTRLSSASVRP